MGDELDSRTHLIVERRFVALNVQIGVTRFGGLVQEAVASSRFTTVFVARTSYSHKGYMVGIAFQVQLNVVVGTNSALDKGRVRLVDATVAEIVVELAQCFL